MKIFSKVALIFSVVFFSASLLAGTNIGYGTIKGYKIGAADSNSIMVYLNDGYTLDNGGCEGIIYIQYADFDGVLRSEKRLDQMMASVMAAYSMDKKVRFHTHKVNSCDATFVALQESFY